MQKVQADAVLDAWDGGLADISLIRISKLRNRSFKICKDRCIEYQMIPSLITLPQRLEPGSKNSISSGATQLSPHLMGKASTLTGIMLKAATPFLAVKCTRDQSTSSPSPNKRRPPSYNAHYGQTVTIKNTGGGDNNNGVGKTITALVADTCPGCDPNHLDLSTGAFKALTGGNLDPPGQFNIKWHLN